jgi:hypothetical protein
MIDIDTEIDVPPPVQPTIMCVCVRVCHDHILDGFKLM